MDNIELFLKELRESSDVIFNIFTNGSCFRLYSILKHVVPGAVPYWSDADAHAVVKIGDNFYDIGGKVNHTYVQDQGYYEVPEELRDGYALLKWVSNQDEKFSVTVGRYRKDK